MSFTRYDGATVGKWGMVAAAHPLAVMEGAAALRRGGNAMDACLVMASVTSVVLPHMCGLGGDAFFIYYDASKNEVVALNGSGPPGDAATIHRYAGRDMLPQEGIDSVAVPGAPLVYELANKRFGTFSLAECFEPGARIAEEGYQVTPHFADAVSQVASKLAGHPESKRVYLKDGAPPRAGEVLSVPELAGSLRAFASEGAKWFYDGPFAEAFYSHSSRLGGPFLGREMLKFLQNPPEFYHPIRTSYRGYTVLETAPVSQGFLVLLEMNMLENFDLPNMEPDQAETIHLMVEAKKLAFRQRNLYAGDPAVTGFDVSRLLTRDYANSLASEIDTTKTRWKDEESLGEGDTTFFVAWDRWGNACSFIHSNAFSFGSGVMVPGTGVILNNRAGRSFVLKEGHPNCLMPDKRPMHTLNCYMVMKDGAPFIVGGTPGGDGQPQWNMQMLSLMLDRGAGPKEAADYPRWTSSPGTDVIGLGKPYQLALENRFPEENVEKLRDMGHAVKIVGPWSGGGGAQIIMRDGATGLLLGGSDRRLEGMALGF